MPVSCPNCNSENLDAYDTSFQENDTISAPVQCDDCGFHWIEFFECTGWTVSGDTFEKTKDKRVFKANEKYTPMEELSK